MEDTFSLIFIEIHRRSKSEHISTVFNGFHLDLSPHSHIMLLGIKITNFVQTENIRILSLHEICYPKFSDSLSEDFFGC